MFKTKEYIDKVSSFVNLDYLIKNEILLLGGNYHLHRTSYISVMMSKEVLKKIGKRETLLRNPRMAGV